MMDFKSISRHFQCIYIRSICENNFCSTSSSQWWRLKCFLMLYLVTTAWHRLHRHLFTPPEES